MSERLPRTYFRSHGDHAWSRIFIWFSRHASREEVCRVQHKRHGGCAGAISNATTASLSLLRNCPCGTMCITPLSTIWDDHLSSPWEKRQLKHSCWHCPSWRECWTTRCCQAMLQRVGGYYAVIRGLQFGSSSLTCYWLVIKVCIDNIILRLLCDRRAVVMPRPWCRRSSQNCGMPQ